MKLAGVVLFAGLAVTSLAAARADDDVERVLEGYSTDGETIVPGPLHASRRADDLRVRLNAAHERAPGDDDLTIRLAVVEERSGHPDRAASLLAEVSAVSSLHALALYDHGLVELRRGRAAEAEKLLADAAAVASDRVEPAFALALARERTGDTAGAVAAFEQAERRAEGPVAASCALRAGRLLETAGELDAALAAFDRATAHERPPTPGLVPALGAPAASARGLADAARVLLRAGRPAEAAERLARALDASETPEVRFDHGLALFLAGQPADADIARLRREKPELADRLAALIARRRDVK